ncbi:CCG-binding protein 1 [Sesamum angolense]|uniref:CCG-binding protein 1 n=1 Tax=Sesamum angolense TaxID=2727404 RepID=A0AAE2BXZ2_9LAMI|nr:CCG-binding protein 1 [Sesamum angolense]
MVQTVPFNCSLSAFLVDSNQSSKLAASGSVFFSFENFLFCFEEQYYCSTLEGDDSYNCWTAYFELKELEKEAPKEELEKLIIEAGGVKSLISCVHGVAAIHKAKQDCSNLRKQTNLQNSGGKACPVPDGLPKTSEELEEEEKARMPDSPFTRLLRAREKHPAWYTPAPEHETD